MSLTPTSPTSNSNGVSYIANLSDDVLALICELTVLSSPYTRAQVRSVCHLWRAIVDEVPACSRSVMFSYAPWAVVNIDLGLLDLKRLVEECRASMRHAQAVPLDLTIRLEQRQVPDTIPDDALPSAGSYVRIIERLTADIDNIVNEAAPTTRSLTIVGGGSLLLPWPKLTALDLSGVHRVSWLSSLKASFDAPSLRNLTLSCLTPCLAECLPSHHHISSVNVSTQSTQDSTLASFLYLISLFPFLERLDVAVEDVTVPLLPPSIPTTLLSLRELNLTSASPPSYNSWNQPFKTSRLWSYIVTPQLTELSVPQRWFEMGPIDDLNLFFDQNGRIPSVIQFVECPWDLAEKWRARQQLAWPTSNVRVERMADYT
ncbi:hypothetical protein B0H12DRAFT_1246382 [Mycena haematopus]|nr:hypothetical protein B0H12DRAFT_1246382 [Mycena haematopus]